MSSFSLTPTKPVSILTKPSVASFLSRDKSSPMHARPWRKLFDEQDRRFRAEWKPEHPAYECRWAIHQLWQREHVATLAYYQAGIALDVRARHQRRQLRIVAAMSGRLWAAVVFGDKRERVAA